MRFGLVVMSLVGFAYATSAAAKSEVDKDTDDRHARASSSSSGSSSSSSSSSDDDDDCEPSSSDELGVGYGTSSSRPPRLDQISGDLELRPRVQLEHFGSSTGGRVIHQEGLGGGLGIDLGLPYFAVDETHRRGMLWRFELGGARLLASHRPEGADYRSTMDLLSISGALVYKYTWLDSFADVSLAVGPGFSFLRVFEEFDDGTPDLDETLVLGLSLSPIMRVDFHDGFFGGTTFVEASVALTAARLSPYADQYDSLIAGLSPFMVTPRARVGELWEVTPGFEVGVTYEFEVVGGLVEGTSFSNALALTLRWSGYVED